jgi:hypothetical protein
LLDQIVVIAMDGSHPQRSKANEFLVMMKDHPGRRNRFIATYSWLANYGTDMWKRADAILESQGSSGATKVSETNHS